MFKSAPSVGSVWNTGVRLYIYKIVAILFLGNATPPTILVIEG